MKISFNPSINYSSPIKKQAIIKNLATQKTNNFGYLNCVANYNLAFCGREKAIYSLDFDGNMQKFNSSLEAAQTLGISVNSICEILSNKRQISQGYTFLKASEIEKKDKKGEYIRNKKGEITFEQSKIKKAREAFLYSKTKFPIVQITKSGELFIFKEAKEASENLKIPLCSIHGAIKNECFCRGSLYLRLADVVKKDKNGNVVYRNNGEYKLDEEKIELYKLVVASN